MSVYIGRILTHYIVPGTESAVDGQVDMERTRK